MFTFIFSILLFVIAAIVFLVSFSVPTRQGRTGTRIGSTVVTLLAFLFLFFSMIQTVSTKNVGVKIAFGKPTGYLLNGFHLIKPWEKVVEFPATIQTDSFAGVPDQKGNGLTVRIATQAQAWVDLSVQWRINPADVSNLYQDYKSFDHLREAVITRPLVTETNKEFSSYNPLSLFDVTGDMHQADLQAYSDRIKQDLIANSAGRVEILSVYVSFIHHDQATQDKLNGLQAAAGDTRIAIQKQQTATAEARANQILSDSIKNDPNVLVSKCMDLIKGGWNPPPGYQCWYGIPSLPLTIPATGK